MNRLGRADLMKRPLQYTCTPYSVRSTALTFVGSTSGQARCKQANTVTSPWRLCLHDYENGSLEIRVRIFYLKNRHAAGTMINLRRLLEASGSVMRK